MKNFICLIVILISAQVSFAQSESVAETSADASPPQTFDVQDFSVDYYARVYLTDPSAVFTKGSVSVYRKKTKKRLIKVDSEELAAGFSDGKVTVNVKELPYGEQSVIIYEDFNFDGVRDFAIMDGQNSCYHGPSFKIFLAARSGFVLSPSFTRLSQDYCGMFNVDPDKKTISTMTKSGCCWHEFSEFIVVKNVPKAIKIIEQDSSRHPLITAWDKSWNGRRMTESKVRSIDFSESELRQVLSFKTQSGDNEVVLFVNGDQLNYIFVSKSGNVDFAFPDDAYADPGELPEKDPEFLVDSMENPTMLSFSNRGVVYSLYEKADEQVGVMVNVKGKVKDIPGDVKTKKGSLRALIGESPTNLSLSK